MSKVPFKDYLDIENKCYKYKEKLDNLLKYLEKNKFDKAIKYAKRKKMYE